MKAKPKGYRPGEAEICWVCRKAIPAWHAVLTLDGGPKFFHLECARAYREAIGTLPT